MYSFVLGMVHSSYHYSYHFGVKQPQIRVFPELILG